MYESTSDQLLIGLDDGVAVITLNRPEARNALSDDLTVNLRAALRWCTDDEMVGAVLITGAGNAFCSGGDVKAMGKRNQTQHPPNIETAFQEMRTRHHEISGALHKLRKPSIAALPGPAAGAGLAIALACDFRIAAQTALLSTAYAKIGLTGDYGIAWLLTRVVGPARARQLLLTAERVSAADALTLGLINQMTSPDTLMVEAFEFAKTLAAGPQIAYAYIKDNLDEAMEIDHAAAIDREADRLLKARSTEDHKEAVAAFAEKRPPKFQGR